jgi:hypothetical protein
MYYRTSSHDISSCRETEAFPVWTGAWISIRHFRFIYVDYNQLISAARKRSVMRDGSVLLMTKLISYEHRMEWLYVVVYMIMFKLYHTSMENCNL